MEKIGEEISKNPIEINNDEATLLYSAYRTYLDNLKAK